MKCEILEINSNQFPQVDAAAGLKIASPDLEGVLPGSTLYVQKMQMKLKNLPNS